MGGVVIAYLETFTVNNSVTKILVAGIHMSKQYCSAYYLVLRVSEKKQFDYQRTKQKKNSSNQTL